MLKVHCKSCATANAWNRTHCEKCGAALTGSADDGDSSLEELGLVDEPVFDDLIGRELTGYRIESMLGQGAVGAVFLATQLKLDRRVALKLLPARGALAHTPFERFREEAKRYAALHNPYIMQVHDLLEADGLIGIAMEYASGGSLRGLLDEHGTLDESNAATIVRQAALGLWEAAKSGLVHRDIKPNNLLLTENGEIKIGDFGLSVITDVAGLGDSLTIGTPAYMAPEQWEDSQHADHRADLYALGCTLFELLSGHPPYPGPSSAEYRAQHCSGEQPPLGDVEVSEAMRRVLLQLLQRDPKKRFQTGAELADRLEPLTYPDEFGDTDDLPCEACGKDNPAEARFCQFCGKRLRKQVAGQPPAESSSELCIGCAKELDPAWTVCPWCGSSPRPTEQDSLEPGSVFADKLKIIRKVGSGGMGYVFEAEHMILQQPVALKVLRPVLRKNTVFVRRFLTEAKASQAFTHKHAVTVREFGQTKAGSLYMVMDYVRGITLERLMRKQGTLPAVWAVGMCVQVLEALAEAHRAGIVHRDLKPANIMIERRGNKNWARVVDFGLAKMLTGKAASKGATRFGTTVGTIIYMSPEQAVAGDLDGRSDLFSLGIILYEMIAGKLPFDDDSLTAVMRKIVHDNPQPLYEACGRKIPRSLSHVVQTALSKRPDDRYPSAEAFRRALVTERDRLAHHRPSAKSEEPPEDDPVQGGESVSNWELPAEPEPAVKQESTCDVEVVESNDPLAQPGILRPPLASKTIRRVKKRMLARGLAYVGQNERGYPEFLHQKSGQTLVLLPGGSGEIGSSHPLAGSVEGRVRQVQLLPFLLGKTAVDNESYAIFLADTGHPKPEFWGKRKFRSPELPVVGVSLVDAQKYARWARLRLPSELEWECAASWGPDGDKLLFPWGEEDPSHATASSLFRRRNPLLNFDNIVGAPCAGDAHPDGASPTGVLDLLGNVFEWTSSKYGVHTMVARGGSWNSPAAQCRPTARLGVEKNTRRSDLGFRVALSFPLGV